jgi:hypothetical protein
MGKSSLHDQVVSPYITQLYYENCQGKVLLVMLNYLLWTLQVDMHDSNAQLHSWTPRSTLVLPSVWPQFFNILVN